MTPIWPNNTKLDIIGGTGEFWSGKTMFGLLIAPGPRTRLYDLEKSAGNYDGLGHERIDVPTEMLKRFPRGYNPINVFEWWYNHVREIAPGTYDVIQVDTASEIESGLVEYVKENCGQFGYTRNQIERSAALLFAAVKQFWEMIMADLASRCQTFYFTTHLRSVFEGGAPVPGKREPKGKDSLFKLASLYLWFSRPKNKDGSMRDEPEAEVLKSRVSQIKYVNGKPAVITLLPPRLPVATPDAIRNYILNPPDYTNLKPEELSPAHELSADDRLVIEATRTQAERETAAMKLETARVASALHDKRAAAPPAVVTQVVPEQVKACPPAADPTAAQPSDVATSQAGTASATEPRASTETEKAALKAVANSIGANHLEMIRILKDKLAIPHEAFQEIVKKRGVESIIQFSAVQAEELIRNMAYKLDVRDLADDFERLEFGFLTPKKG